MAYAGCVTYRRRMQISKNSVQTVGTLARAVS